MLLLQTTVLSFKFIASLKSMFCFRLQAFFHSECCYFSVSLIVLDSGSQENFACVDEPLLQIRWGRRALCLLGIWLLVSSCGHVSSSGEGGLSGIWPWVWYSVKVIQNQTGLYLPSPVIVRFFFAISGFTSVFDNFETFAKQQGFEWS